MPKIQENLLTVVSSKMTNLQGIRFQKHMATLQAQNTCAAAVIHSITRVYPQYIQSIHRIYLEYYPENTNSIPRVYPWYTPSIP